MKKFRRWMAAGLVLALLSTTLLAAAPARDEDYYPVAGALDCARYLAGQYAAGIDTAHVIFSPGGTANAYAEDIFMYVRMLVAEYYTLYRTEYGSGRRATFRISLEGREGERRQAEQAARQAVGALDLADMTPQEKLRALHDYLAAICTYDTAAAQNKSRAPDQVFTAYGALIDGKAVCDGYSAAFALLCRYAGIPCIQVFDRDMGGGSGHSWNVVLYNGRALHADVTYDDWDVGGLSYDFYLKTDAEMRALGHSWDQKRLDSMLESLWNFGFKAAYNLETLGLFRGTPQGYELERAPFRSEAALMLLRLLGEEERALLQGGAATCPFADVNAFYAPYVTYLHQRGLTRGTGAGTFSPQQKIGIQEYLSFVLRALGYDDSGGDFTWNDALGAAVRYGVLTQGEAGRLAAKAFDRGDMAYISHRALYAQMKDGRRLADYLDAAGALRRAAWQEIENNT